MHIYLLRHGQTVSPGTYSGKIDVPLSETGEKQINHISPYVSRLEPEICFISPLSRCRRTYELLGLDEEHTIDEDLSEIGFGEWEGRTFGDIYKKDRNNLEKWLREKDAFTFPGGDNIYSFSIRIKKWFEKLVQENYKNVLIVSHSGVIRYGLCHLLNLDISLADKFAIEEGLVSLVHFEDNHAVLKLLNSRG